jgi:hypothetical protein
MSLDQGRQLIIGIRDQQIRPGNRPAVLVAHLVDQVFDHTRRSFGRAQPIGGNR